MTQGKRAHSKYRSPTSENSVCVVKVNRAGYVDSGIDFCAKIYQSLISCCSEGMIGYATFVSAHISHLTLLRGTIHRKPSLHS